MRKAHEASHTPIVLTFPLKVCLTKGGLKLILEGTPPPEATPDSEIVKLLQTAHAYKTLVLDADEEISINTLAQRAGVSASYFTRVLRLAWLAPDITAALLDGRHPPTLNALKLKKQSQNLPLDWPGQRTTLQISTPDSTR